MPSGTVVLQPPPEVPRGGGDGHWALNLLPMVAGLGSVVFFFVPGANALMMIVGGTIVTQFPGALWPRRKSIWIGTVGIVVALLVFMETSIAALRGGEEAIRTALPTHFNWPWFMLACALMSVVIADLLVQRRSLAVNENR